jgi:hypothetical protein
VLAGGLWPAGLVGLQTGVMVQLTYVVMVVVRISTEF